MSIKFFKYGKELKHLHCSTSSQSAALLRLSARHLSCTERACVLNDQQQRATATAHSLNVTKFADTTEETNSRSSSSGSSGRIERQQLDFTDIQNAFKSKTSFELVRGGLVYQLCTIKFLVDNGLKVRVFILLLKLFLAAFGFLVLELIFY